jgi:MATE family multidrug resistance protein
LLLNPGFDRSFSKVEQPMSVLKFVKDDQDFFGRFFRLAAINVLSNLMVPLASLMDMAFLGHLPDIHHLAGVALATVIFNYLYWTFGFLRMGTTGLTAQAIGRDDPDEVMLIGLRNGLIALIAGIGMVLLQEPLRIIGFGLLSATTEVKASGQIYYSALIWGAPATLINMTLVGWFLGREQSAKVLLLSSVGNGTKILLEYLFVVQWGWQSLGAGRATSVSQYLMLLVGVCLVCSDRTLQWHIPQLRQKLLDTHALKASFTLNSAIVIRTFAFGSTFATFTNLSSAMGTAILTANALMLQVVSLAAYFIDGLAFATETMAGVFYGKNHLDKLALLVRVSGITSLGLGLTFAIGFIAIPNRLFGLLTNHTEIMHLIREQVPWLLLLLGFASIAYMLDGYFLGLTQAQIIQNSALIATLVGFAPIAAIAGFLQNVHLLWFAMTVFMATRALTLALHVPQTFQKSTCIKADKPLNQV